MSNDSGAMHLAGAVGAKLVALFGPTIERETAPRPTTDDSWLTTDDRRPTTTILVHPVWCRPCMLRECPLDHACMRGIGVDDVRAAVDRTMIGNLRCS